MAKQKEISVPKKGMNRSTSPFSLNEGEYSFAKNANLSNEYGEELNITNEHSNILATKFKEGFKVIGLKADRSSNSTYYFLVDQEEGISEIGVVKNINTLPELGDEVLDCEDCNYKIKLSDPLETQIQSETQTYSTLLNDECNGCLNFNINNPIKSIELKDEKCGKVMYFTDGLNGNPPRYIELDNLEKYSYTGEELCGDDSNVENTCAACDKMKIFKGSKMFEIEPQEIVIGGNLKRGTYEFVGAYCDEAGNELSRYFTITNPISIFDENNNVLQQREIADETNYAIKLNIKNLDLNYTHYKIAVIQRTDINFATSYFIEGIHSTSDNTVIYTTDNGKERTSLSLLNKFAIRINKWKSLTSSNGYLFGSGLEYEKRYNLQPVINLMGGFLNWQTTIASENLYKSGIADSKYRGYYRDETYPMGIRFLLDGEYTPVYPLIGRPPTSTDIEEVPSSNNDRGSIEKLESSCVETDISKRWQIYNTAKQLGECSLPEGLPTNTITEAVRKICYLENVDNIENGEFSITLEEGQTFVDIESYIEENKETLITNSRKPDCISLYGEGLCEIGELLDEQNYTETNCTPDFENTCTISSTPLEEEIIVEDIIGEEYTRIERVFPDEYALLPPPEQCDPYKIDYSTGDEIQDEDFAEEYFSLGGALGTRVYRRNYSSVNENCSYAKEIPEYNISTQYLAGNINTYYGGDTLAEVQTNLLSHPDCFTNTLDEYISKGALWFKKDTSKDKDFIIDITAHNEYEFSSKPYTRISQTDGMRLNIFDSCSGTSIYCKNILFDEGYSFKCRIDQNNVLYLKDNQGNPEENLGTINSNNLYMVLDCPISENEDSEGNVTYVVRPTRGCFGIASKSLQYKQIDITFEEISVAKKETYEASCEYEVPIITNECDPQPYRFGEFSYVESTETYPDNTSLYNSSVLKILPEDIPDDVYYGEEGSEKTYQEYFQENYTEGVGAEGYVLNENTDYTCKPIRHFKFPDNNIAPFTYQNSLAPFTETTIYPMGVSINEEIVVSFLDIAVKNKLITQEERNKIQSYEIVRGDRTANQSIIGKGVAFDMMSYNEDGKDIMYANYPFNDLGADKLNFTDSQRDTLIPHPYNGEENFSWTVSTPETDYNKVALPSFMKVEGYLYGKSRGYFNEVREHPKWVILGKKLENLASTLATIELVAETVIKAAEMTSRQWFVAGFANGTSLGLVATGVVLAFDTAASVIYKYARYKYEWLDTFINLGTTRNFSYYYSAEGYYNYFKPNTDEGNTLRYLNVAKNIKDGRSILTDSIAGERLEVNHRDRENTVLVSTGKEYPIEYDLEYKSYDNNTLDFNSSSRTIASEANVCSKGLSSEVIRNTASMYVTLKNYVPSQYGTIGSIKWLSTGYRGDLNNPSKNCNSIFGGDVFITRHTLRRALPLFNTTAMNQASMTPFEYKFYSNIGKEPRFYCNYGITGEDTSAGNPIPDPGSEYNFDCQAGENGNYVKEPSKFYMQYTGIPNYLTETTINTWNRYAKPEPWNNFYPNVGDLMEWTQEVVNPIRRGNKFFYNPTYSKQVTPSGMLTLPSNYEKEEYDCRTDAPSGTMYSLPDNSENGYTDPWLTFRPLDKYEFPTSYGDLVELKGIETGAVLGRFENQTVIFNAVDTIVDDGSNPDTQILGTGGIFARRPRTFAETDLGYAGSQSFQMVSSEYGHFFPDAKRGQVFKVNIGGNGMEELSAYVGDKPSGMKQWFKRNLPFKILKYFPDVDIDNPYNGVGISMGWDSVYKRVFLTKKDYTPITDCVEYKENRFLLKESCGGTTCPEGYTYNETTEMCENNGSNCESTGADIVFVIDRTTSQSLAIESIKNSIATEIIPAITSKFGSNYRFGLTTVSDERVEGVGIFENVVEMTLENNTEIINGINNIVLGGNFNAGVPEPTDLALEAVLNNTKEVDMTGSIISGSTTIGTFREGVSKAIFMITDASPSGLNDTYEYTDWLNADNLSTQASNEGIKIFSILTSEVEGTKVQPTVGSTSQTAHTSYIMENYAIATGGEYYFKSLGQGINSDIVDAIDNNLVCDDEVEPIQQEIKLEDKNYFKDVSWTIAYSNELGSWLSYYDFKPNYYVAHNDYFQTGLNKDGDEFGLWSHLLTDKSYQVFYGNKYDFILEYPIKTNYMSKQLNNVEFWTEAKRFEDNYDYTVFDDVTFNKSIIYNNSANTGELNLIPQKNNFAQIATYPKTNPDNTQDILITNLSDDIRWGYDYFFDRIKNRTTMFINDDNTIDKFINKQAVSFKGKRILERMTGDWFLNRLTYDKDSRYSLTFRFALNETQN